MRLEKFNLSKVQPEGNSTRMLTLHEFGLGARCEPPTGRFTLPQQMKETQVLRFLARCLLHSKITMTAKTVFTVVLLRPNVSLVLGAVGNNTAKTVFTVVLLRPNVSLVLGAVGNNIGEVVILPILFG